MPLKVLIIGGVAGGASAAARLRRINEDAKIIMFEKGEYVSFEGLCKWKSCTYSPRRTCQ